METLGFFGDFVVGIEPEKQGTTLKDTKLTAGRFLLRGDRYRAVVGNNVARKSSLKVGDEIEIKSKKIRGSSSITHVKNFTIVGIMEFTGTDFDYIIAIPLEISQDFYDMGGKVSYIWVVPEADADASDLADRIELNVENVITFPPEEMRKQTEQSLVVINLITISAAFLAAIIGGLSVMNTMFMSVSERTKEFGLMKAMGAEKKDILLLTLGESGLIGLIGGILGIIAGGIFIYYLNEYLASMGTVLFAVTPRLVVIALLFAVILGALSGIFPAYRAVKMSPMEALRYE
jgi:putative ABC transport system permease protein